MPRTVTARLTDLQAGRTYHYRVVAWTDESGEARGDDATFVAR